MKKATVSSKMGLDLLQTPKTIRFYSRLQTDYKESAANLANPRYTFATVKLTGHRERLQ